MCVVKKTRDAEMLYWVADKERDARGSDAKWFYVEKERKADKTICWVDKERNADLKVYQVTSERGASGRF